MIEKDNKKMKWNARAAPNGTAAFNKALTVFGPCVCQFGGICESVAHRANLQLVKV